MKNRRKSKQRLGHARRWKNAGEQRKIREQVSELKRSLEFRTEREELAHRLLGAKRSLADVDVEIEKLAKITLEQAKSDMILFCSDPQFPKAVRESVAGRKAEEFIRFLRNRLEARRKELVARIKADEAKKKLLDE